MECDRLAIGNQLARFARIVDSRDWDAVGEVFAEDVSFDYGDGREQSGIAAMREQFRVFLGGCGPSQHLIGSIAIELDGDAAISRAYVQARHQGRGDKGDRIFDTHGDYVDRWARTPAGWRIVRRDAHWSMHVGDPSVLGPG
ncbi:DUF4440 domain-containing protein [Sphingomonas histidinilytica]|uniref:SnoaL-like domain-containing protein n=1 Tax=Rhizorhabdus histidinilytica TaxID=439228 RepID=A0A1T5E0Z4_9SPHN|nr:nuclear transport factor 2 family protein [Rhizorhabdus histidinilytica]MBO9378015.1 DUF4440 domain-containing protein [Rhizorhabdus histidinilytica]SKB77625.1 SnoaL-like domain-containing protein [Rhizorhabdus histidinilytica]